MALVDVFLATLSSTGVASARAANVSSTTVAARPTVRCSMRWGSCAAAAGARIPGPCCHGLLRRASRLVRRPRIGMLRGAPMAAPAPAPGFATLVNQRLRRRNTRILLAYFAFVAAVVGVEAAIFKALMWWSEGRQQSFATGVYWVLSTMSTLGLGDIVFVNTAGRLFTVFVLMTGIILLLAVLPFAFIRFFYAPWLASRTVPPTISGHVVIAGHGDLARPLLETLELHGIPHFLVEPDQARAAELDEEGIPVVSRPLDEPQTYRILRIEQAAMVVLDGSDAENTTSALQIHDLAPKVHIASVAASEQGEEILRLAGVRRVLPLKRQLGQHLAARLNAGHAQTHVIGRLRDLLVAELPVHLTPWVGQTIHDLGLRRRFGVNVVGILEQAQFTPVTSATRLGPQSVPVVVGSAAQLRDLDEFLVIYNVNYNPVVIVGGGIVGCAASRVLRKRGVPVHIVGLDEHLPGAAVQPCSTRSPHRQSCHPRA